MPNSHVRILLVDDDEDDYIVIRDLFDELANGYKLEWLSSYDAALAAMARREHELYLVDYRLGAQTGLDLLRAAIEAGYEAPIILLTGHGDHEIDIEAMRVGASDYLVKGKLTAPLLERSIRYSIHHAETIRRLREREENFRDLFNSTFEGVVIHKDGKIIDANRPAADIFGYSRRDMLGTQIESLAPDRAKSALREAAESKTGAPQELVGMRKDGTELFLEVAAKLYHYRGEDVRLVAIRNISSRKQMETQILLQDRLASVGLLASSLAHEIGTPLGVIRGRAEFLALQVKDDANVRKNVEIIASQIDRVSSLIRSLLNLARGEHKANISGVLLDRIVNEVVELMAHQLRKEAIRLENRVSPDAKIMARAEADPLHQVLLNLLVNAVHAIESAIKQGRKDNHLISIFTEDAGDQWALSVQDTGTGISPANLKNLFKAFFTTKDIGEGTGLGLLTSYRIVEAWGGKITVQSQEGVGTTFRVLLPKA